jgi:competence protein ComEC
LHPQVAIVSAGRSNHFGHPVPEVLDRYRSIGAEVFRTDRDGAVTVDTDGRSMQVHTFTGRTFDLFDVTTYHEATKNTKDTKP